MLKGGQSLKPEQIVRMMEVKANQEELDVVKK
jgi:hypothetical protein